MTFNSTILISQWNNTSLKINCYFSIFLFLFGVIGNILNTLVLSQRSLRSNSCAWLFLISSIFNLISIVSGLSTRILSIWFIDPTDEINWLCKLRVFIVLTSRTVASWLIILATIDRWLLSCKQFHYRRWSKLKNAKYGMVFVIIISIALYFPIFYCYQAKLPHSPLRCYSKNIKCQIFADQTYVIFTILIPLILMIFFGLLTLSNIRRMRVPLPSRSSQKVLIYNRYHQRLKALDRRLFLMLLVQISFLTLFTFPQAIEMIYLTITKNQLKSPLQMTIENSIFTFSLLLTYLASGIPFYIYTLCGGYVFRQAFWKLIQRVTGQ